MPTNEQTSQSRTKLHEFNALKLQEAAGFKPRSDESIVLVNDAREALATAAILKFADYHGSEASLRRDTAPTQSIPSKHLSASALKLR